MPAHQAPGRGEWIPPFELGRIKGINCLSGFLYLPSPCACFSSGRTRVTWDVPVLIPFCHRPSCLPWPGLAGPTDPDSLATVARGGRVLLGSACPHAESESWRPCPQASGAGAPYTSSPTPFPSKDPPEIQPWCSPLQDGFYRAPALRQSSVSCGVVGGKILAPQPPLCSGRW